MRITVITSLKHKENYVFFKVRWKQLPFVPFDIRINNETFEHKTYTKFLGIYVDENLNWKEHVNFLNLSALYQRPDSTFPCPRCVLYILLFSIPTCNMQPLFRALRIKLPWIDPIVLQKRIRRVNTKSCFDAPSAPLFYKHNFLNITNIYTLQISLFMFSFKNKSLPVSFHDMFLSSSQLHSYNTRNALNYKSQFSRAMLGNLQG